MLESSADLSMASENQRIHGSTMSLPVERQAGLVAADVPGDLERQRRRDGDPEPGLDDPADENPADPPVAVSEGMNGLELGLSDRRLGDWVETSPVDEGNEIGHEIGDGFGRRCDMGSELGVRTSDPAEHVTPGPDVVIGDVRAVLHQPGVPVEQHFHRERCRGR